MKRRNLKQYKDPGQGGLYFIASGPDGLYVKIGIASDVKERLKNLQVGNPIPLKLLGYVPDRDREMERFSTRGFAFLPAASFSN